MLALTSCTKFESASLSSSGDGTSADTLAPPAPLIMSPLLSSLVTSANLVVGGACEDGAIITLTGSILNSPVTDVCIDSGFSKSVILSSTNGLKTVYVSQADASNNISVVSSITITLDINAPAAPTIASPLNDVKVISQTQIISGACQSGSTVSISGSIASSPVTAPCVSSAYSRSVTLSANNGLKSINVMQVDLNGNASASRSIMITFDNIAPAMPTVTSPSSGSIVGGLAQTLIGGCETGATLSLSGSIVGSPVTVLCANSTYSRPVTLSTGSGLKTINLIQTDLAGNVSPNRTYTISVDTTAPLAPTITSPVNGSTVGVVAQTVVGSCEQGAVVSLVGAIVGSPITMTCLASSYSRAITLVSGSGLKTIGVFQTDSANNMSAMASVTITLDMTAPSAPTVSSPANGSVVDSVAQTILGSCETGATLSLSGALVGSPVTVLCSASSYSRSITLVSGFGSKVLNISQRDVAGNISVNLSVTLNYQQAEAIDTSASQYFACDAAVAGSKDLLKRLSKTEYLNTLQDLLKTKLTSAEVTSVMSKASVNSSMIPNDTSGKYTKLDQRMTETHIESYYNTSQDIAQELNVSYRSKFFGSCVSAIDAACVRAFIKSFGRISLRRPVTSAEETEIYNFYVTRGATGLPDLVAYFLNAPEFLYHLENQGVQAGTQRSKITSYEVASRLSYLYYESMPNAYLIDLANRDLLKNNTEVAAAIDQLFILEQSRIKNMWRGFNRQWLKIDSKPGFTSTPQILTLATQNGISAPTTALRTDMVDELLTLVDYYTWDQPQGGFDEVLTSDVSFAKTADLAKIYGVAPWVQGQALVRFPASEKRSGLLTRAGSVYTGTFRTNPIKFGVRVINDYLCDQIPNPPQDVIDDVTRNLNIDHANITERTLVDQMTNQPKCIGCHSSINPYGFAAETYDSFGKYRTRFSEYKFDNAGAVVRELITDSRSTIKLNGKSINIVDAVDMSSEISKRRTAHACYVRNVFRYAHRRSEVNEADECEMGQMYDVLNDEAQGGILGMMKSAGTRNSFFYKNY